MNNPNNKPEANYAKLAAILKEAFEMGVKNQRPVSAAEASFQFARMFEADFWRRKAQEDFRVQLKEIDTYKYGESFRMGFDIGLSRAESEWTEKYAAAFRRHRESPWRNGFFFFERIIANTHGLHMRPSHEISEVVRANDCNVFVNHEKVQDRLVRDFVMSLDPEEQDFIGKLMPSSDVLNLSALAAITRERAGSSLFSQTEKDEDNKRMASISLKYHRFQGDCLKPNIVEMADYDLIIEDENNVKRPYLELSYRKFQNEGSVTPDLLSLQAIPGDIIRFVIFGKDKDAAAADILYILSKQYLGKTKEPE